jgi:hypothetical protein
LAAAVGAAGLVWDVAGSAAWAVTATKKNNAKGNFSMGKILFDIETRAASMHGAQFREPGEMRFLAVKMSAREIGAEHRRRTISVRQISCK